MLAADEAEAADAAEPTAGSRPANPRPAADRARPASDRTGAASGREGAASSDSWPMAVWLLLLVAFAVLDLAIYHSALQGPFISDDIGYIQSSPYTRDLSVESGLALFDPTSAAHLYTANYAPVHLLLTAVERSLFGDAVLGFHLVNVVIHALNSLLLVALLRRSRLATPLAVLGGVVFAVHPANVEAVAWISQLKTNGALALSLGALLALPRRPAAATVLFALALLTKASALFALPTAAVFIWARASAEESRRSWGWLAAWTLIAGLYAIPQFGFFGATGGTEGVVYDSLGVQLRSIAGYAPRYLVMAATGYGVSAFQEPLPARSLLDPWWLASLPLAGAIVWRMIAAARKRSEELAYWIAAVVSFGPVSQILPFLIPTADRYLYFILPGLIGAAAFLWLDLRDRLPAGPRPSQAAAAAVVVLAASFAVTSAERAKLWTNETFLNVDAARHYPDGGTAAFMAARSAAQQGDAAAAVAALRRAADRGVDRVMMISSDPGLAPIRDAPEFQAFLREMASLSIRRVLGRDDPSAPELRLAAHAHILRDEWVEAEAMLERALLAGGPFEPVVRTELAQVRRRLAADPGPAGRESSEEGAGHRTREP
jgi:hypothetical protein